MRIVLTLIVGSLDAIGPAFAADKAPAATAPAATAPTPLDKYLDNLKTLRASFLQTLADPQGHEIDRPTGTLIVARPGKFRWDMHPQAAVPKPVSDNKGAGQKEVCDGRHRWVVDRDPA